MEIYKIENLNFTYSGKTKKALSDINISIMDGEFVTLCGKSGCGKTTFLKMLKTVLSPHGTQNGSIFFNGCPLASTDTKKQASDIGFVMQNPDNQIVTDKVWHELAFGLESLGYSTSEIRTKVSEMASFFGIQTWFHQKTTELSGGQKQLLNLAAILAMQPSVIILDEPTSQLDPIAAHDFLKNLKKINNELGTTIILSEHRLEEALPISDRVVVIDDGKIIADSSPRQIGKILKSIDHDMCSALPTPMRVYNSTDSTSQCPLTVRDGRLWLENFSKNAVITNSINPAKTYVNEKNPIIEGKDIWFRYDKNLPDVIKGMNIKINKGEFFAIVGGNGVGKSTALSLLSGLVTPYRGKISINGNDISKIKNLYNILGVLPQNPQSLFTQKTLLLDLMEIFSENNLTNEEKEKHIENIATLCQIENLLGNHPYDLSGGEQQRAALAKILLKSPEILLLDEPTKGMDAHFKEIFGEILNFLKSTGVTIIMVSHDIEFSAEFADRCAMFFDGNIISTDHPRIFFAGKNFYTTSANRMARTVLPDAILANDIIRACGGKINTKKIEITKHTSYSTEKLTDNNIKPVKRKKSFLKTLLGIIFAFLFIITCIFQHNNTININSTLVQIITLSELTAVLLCFIPQKNTKNISVLQFSTPRSTTKRTLSALLLILVIVPLTIFSGMIYLPGNKYYIISLLIILETMIPFLMLFEKKESKARELIIISVLCAIAVAGRSAFFMIPQFKPMTAIIIITGVCLGCETGFLVGVVSGFVSNFFFGQGAWTPWQMFAFGIIGFISGIFFRKGFFHIGKLSLSVFGFLSTLLIYGGIVNPASVILWQTHPTIQMITASYIYGFPFDIIHALSTAFFLWFISFPMIDKLERVKNKYGLIEY